VDGLENLPTMLKAAIAWDAWLRIEPLHGNAWRLTLLAASLLRAGGLTQHHLLAIGIGGRRSRYRDDGRLPFEQRILGFLDWIQLAVESGQKELQRLSLAEKVLRQVARHNHVDSRLPALIDLVLTRPLISSEIAKRELNYGHRLSPHARGFGNDCEGAERSAALSGMGGALSRLIGYARVSTDEQSTDAQLDALRAAGCAPIFTEHRSGADRDRPELGRALAAVGAGDVLVVTRLDRLARSVRHLLEVIDELRKKGAAFRSLGDPVDTSTPQGVFTIRILAAVAELERELISARTRSGLKAAIARGARPGNPGVRARRPEAIEKIRKTKAARHLDKIVASADDWLPIVRRMRPTKTWEDVVVELNKDPANRGGVWRVERLQRAVRRLVGEHLAEPELLGRAPRRPANPSLIQTVAAMRRANPGITLREIGRQLEAMRVRSPRGHPRWSPSMVASLLRVNAEAPPA
jgi:DNA invertase Pin-like site-specific DNA recombinase